VPAGQRLAPARGGGLSSCEGNNLRRSICKVGRNGERQANYDVIIGKPFFTCPSICARTEIISIAADEFPKLLVV
jgi:hypothetical protein